MSATLLDTSIVIGGAEPLGIELPEQLAISVITLGELRAGVRIAADQRSVLLASAV